MLRCNHRCSKLKKWTLGHVPIRSWLQNHRHTGVSLSENAAYKHIHFSYEAASLIAQLWTHYGAEPGLELLVFLLLSPKDWDHRIVLPHLALRENRIITHEMVKHHLSCPPTSSCKLRVLVGVKVKAGRLCQWCEFVSWSVIIQQERQCRCFRLMHCVSECCACLFIYKRRLIILLT